MSQAPAQDQQRWIWPFELLDKIGEGGMGVVYRARYVVNDKSVAVKLIPSDVTDETLLARFERELEILKTLRHPNIVRCFGGVCENQRRFYAMELVEGGALDELLATQGRLPPMKVVEYGLQMCAALGYAHERGVIHRDIKPGNFLITPAGQLKLSDFGLASVEAARKITAAGRTMGTYRYMSPEQIRGKSEQKTDLYALGCVLFEMLVGHPPFAGETPAEILQKHMKQPAPRLSTLLPNCPPALDQLVADLLEKDPTDRPENAAEIARQLREASQIVAVEKVKPAMVPTAAAPTATAVLRDVLTEAAPRAATVPTGVLMAAVLLVGLLLAWNVSLRRTATALEQAETLWIEAYRTGEPASRAAAAAALGRLGQRSDRARETLLAGLKEPDNVVRAATVRALGETGDKNLNPTLTRMQREDTEPAVTAAASTALTRLGSAAEHPDPSSWPYWLIGTATLGAAGFVWWRQRAAGG